MNTHRPIEPGEITIDAGSWTPAALRQITERQLLQLGTRQVVYLKSGIHDGERAFVLYGADGTPLAIVDTIDTAVEMVAEHGLGFVTIH